MLGIRTKLKRKSRLKSATTIRKTRDCILKSQSENECVYFIRQYLNYQNNTISHGGNFSRCWANIVTEFRTFSGWGNTELEALKMAGINIYKSRRNFSLSQNQ